MDSYVGVFVAVIFAGISYWIIQRKRRFSLFQRYGIPGPKPSFWTGNLNEYIEKREKCVPEWTKKYGKFVGFYFGAKPMLIAYDVGFIKTIQIKEFRKFSNKDPILPDAGMPHRSSFKFIDLLHDEEWKRTRASLSVAFSTGKIKKIFSIVSHAVGIFMKNIKQQNHQPFDILTLFKKLTFDTTSKASFGIATNVQNNEKSKFIDSVYSAFSADSSDLLAFISVCFPEFEPIPTKLRAIMDVCKYLLNKTSYLYLAKTCEKMIETRKTMKDPPTDLLQTMINANAQYSLPSNQDSVNGSDFHGVQHKMSDDEVLANAIGMMAAGYHTTSTTMGFCAYFLSLHPEVQEKVRKEINEHFKPEEEIEYAGLVNLQYLDQVISETQRLFPVVALPEINRVCKEDFKYNGITIPKGIVVVVPSWTLHRDPEYWPDPESFIPERFSPENRGNIDAHVYQPFGAGPRMCIGMRLANSIMKYTLANLIRNYRLETCDDGKELEVKYLFFLTEPKKVLVKAIPV